MVNPNTFIVPGVTLLALAAGLQLLLKTNKENLGVFYKIASWFIIAVSILTLGCSALNCMARFYSKHYMGHGQGWKMPYEMMRYHGSGYHQKCCGQETSCGHGMEQCCAGHMGMQHGCCDRMSMENSCGSNMGSPGRGSNWKQCYESLRDSCNKQMMHSK